MSVTRTNHSDRSDIRWLVQSCDEKIRRSLLAICILAAGASPAVCQQPTLPEIPQPQQKSEQAIHDEAEREVHNQEQQRILKVVPNFNTALSGYGVRLSAAQKTHLAVHATLDPFNVVGAFVLGGVSEVGDSYRGYGWGPAGYFKRVGANYLDVVDGTMLAGAVYPILLKQDPRYFRQGTGSVRSRLLHALASPFVCRGDNGDKQVNFSNILGNYTAGAISTAYYPAQDRGVGLVLKGGSIVLVEGSLGNIGLEFSPDVSDWWRTRRERKNAAMLGKR